MDSLFTARFGAGHAFGCNSAESEPIRMKSGALCRGLALADFGHAICTVATAGDPGDFFLSGKQRTISPISSRPNLTKFEQNMSIGAAMKTFEENFYNFTEKVVYPKNATISKKIQRLATSGRHRILSDTTRCDIFTCAQKLTIWPALSLAHGKKKQKITKKLKTKAD